MSEENVELVRRSVEAYGRGDTELFFEMFDPAIEWHGTPEAVVGSAAMALMAFVSTWRSGRSSGTSTASSPSRSSTPDGR